jgi:purine nucleosidase
VVKTPAFSRRDLLAGGVVFSAAPVWGASLVRQKAENQARLRVIVDNDIGGDPDGLFQLAHFVMCQSVEIPLVVGSHYKDFGAADLVRDKAGESARKAAELLRFFPQSRRPLVIAGANQPISSRQEARPSPATSSIIGAAMRAETSAPLFYAAGGSLTELALAWLAEPAIGKRLRLVWIGGGEHAGLATPPPGPVEAEYNFSLDRLAAQIIFNESDIEIWQVPRNAFRQALIGLAELEALRRANALGKYLRDQVVQTERRLAENLPRHIFSAGETYMLGDTALVTLTALQSPFQPDSSSSAYAIRPTPTLAKDGSYISNPSGRPMRIYSSIDANLTWRDFAAKLRLNSRR